MNDRTLELMNLVIDGEATKSDRAELEARMAASPELRHTLEELEQVALHLERAAAVDSPPFLKDEVLARIRAAVPVAPLRGTPARPVAQIRRFRTFAFAAALAAGIFMTVILHPALRTRMGFEGFGPAESSGAMVPLGSTAWSATQRLATADRTLSVVVRQREELVRIEPSLANGSSLAIRWNREALDLVGTRGSTDGRSSAVVECGAQGCEPLVFKFRHQNRVARVDLTSADDAKLGFLLHRE